MLLSVFHNHFWQQGWYHSRLQSSTGYIPFSQLPYEKFRMAIGQISDSKTAILLSFFFVESPHKEELPPEVPIFFFKIILGNNRNRVRLFHVRPKLCKYFIIAYANGNRHSQLPFYSFSYLVGYLRPVSKKQCTFTDIKPAFVQSKGFHSVGVIFVNLAGIFENL